MASRRPWPRNYPHRLSSPSLSRSCLRGEITHVDQTVSDRHFARIAFHVGEWLNRRLLVDKYQRKLQEYDALTFVVPASSLIRNIEIMTSKELRYKITCFAGGETSSAVTKGPFSATIHPSPLISSTYLSWPNDFGELPIKIVWKLSIFPYKDGSKEIQTKTRITNCGIIYLPVGSPCGDFRTISPPLCRTR
jgi:hypothetical protein